MEEGWEKAFTVERRRVEEYIELYRSMGYDVKVVDVDTCDRDCGVCYLQGDYVELWIRKSKMTGDEDIC
ncbi:hypothetical protein [Geoglobus acetivorans]|uniref:Uncharacterized protein n=1 Tax=Geoglobus acetivorans TaxID=565033 RepID=A0A0A7GFY6_GEOAI|nr:hypothetical protein GACE_0801 [Geoglobus acetivorans]